MIAALGAIATICAGTGVTAEDEPSPLPPPEKRKPVARKSAEPKQHAHTREIARRQRQEAARIAKLAAGGVL